ncbi:hypothetical protein [Candidatus Albibeggiatoa sp. nov. NOAA]|uniref:hypothetical protein n=1 Tax=Candidatus Albibeggiatoa sp. nov. NOAA TaxID=3162724 RepID=UPI0032FC0D13|nr:hypothetical protein [Thiotrichaceae bacterium]
MTTQLEEAVVELITETDELTHEVINKIQTIDQRVTDAEIELDTHWTEKSTVINNEWISKKAEIDAKLSTFDNKIIYVAPTAQNASTGIDADNATTLADALTNHLIPSVANTIKLTAGVHVLPTQELKDVFLINFEPAEVYDSNNPPIICTPNTIDSSISTSTTGITSDSQICDAHGYDEAPLIFRNSTVQFNNIWLRGTRHCLKLHGSTMFALGDVHLDLWVHSASCTSHSGTALHAVESNIYSDATLSINLWHPDYTGCTDVLANHAAPIFLDHSQHIQKGKLIWSSNIEPSAYPKQMSIGWRTPFETSHATALNVVNGSQLHIERLKVNNVMQLFWADESKFSVAFMEMDELSQPLTYFGQARGQNTQVSLTDRNAAWYDNAEPNIVRVENVTTDPEQACLIAFDGAQIYLDGVKLTSTATACGTLLATETANALLQRNVVYAPDRDNNQGFMQIAHNTGGQLIAKANTFTTRLGDNDTGFVTVEGGFTKLKANTLDVSHEYQISTYGRHQDDEGNTYGGEVSTANNSDLEATIADKVFNVADYANLEAVIADINNSVFAPSTLITLNLPAGNHVLSQDLAIENLDNLIIQGEAPLSRSLVSLIGATGSAGNWNITLQLSNTTGVDVGDYLLVHDAFGVPDQEMHIGGLEIIAKSGNNVTVKNYYPDSSFPDHIVRPGGMANVIKTKISGHISLNHCSNVQFNNITIDTLHLNNVADMSIDDVFVKNGLRVDYSQLLIYKAAMSSRDVYAALHLNHSSAKIKYYLAVNAASNVGVFLEYSRLDDDGSVLLTEAVGEDNNLITIAYCQGEGVLASKASKVFFYSVPLILFNSIDYHATLDSYIKFVNSYLGTGFATLSPAINTEGNSQSLITTN